MKTKLHLKVLLSFTLLYACAPSGRGSHHVAKQGQEKIDSLEVALKGQAQPDTIQARTLYTLSFLYSHVNTTRGLDLGEQALILCKDLCWERGIMASYNNIGANYLNLSDGHKAISYFDSAIVIGKKINLLSGLATNYRNRGIAKKLLGDPQAAKNDHRLSFEIYKNTGSTEGMLAALCNIGCIFLENDQPDSALTYFEKSTMMAEEIDSKSNLAVNYNNSACAYTMKGNQHKAEYYGMKALKLSTELKDNYNLLLANKNLGVMFMQAGDHAQADSYFRQALAYAEQLNSSDRRSQAWRYIGENHLLACKKQSTFTWSNTGLLTEKFPTIGKDSIEKICYRALAEVNPYDNKEVLKTLNIYAEAQEFNNNLQASAETRKVCNEVKGGEVVNPQVLMSAKRSNMASSQSTLTW